MPAMNAVRLGLWSFLFWMLTACSPPAVVQQQAYVFGTLVEISVVDDLGSRATPAISAVLTRFDALHRQLHAWQPSELSQLNVALSQGQTAEVSPELAIMLRDAQTVSAQSNNLFNPAIGGLIALWGFHTDVVQSRIPEADAIRRRVDAAPRMANLLIEPNSVSSTNPSVQLDLGGYAKGYALDEAVRILKAHGIQHALVNIGGNVIAMGQHGDRPWRVGIQHPRQPGTLATIDLNDGEAIGTSGDYQRYFEANGKRYSHLIDPRTGYPATGMQSVTVLVSGAQAGTRSDALSKPLFIDGTTHLVEHAAQLGITNYLAVDATGKIVHSPAMQARLR